MISDNVKKGVERTPNKSLMYALGLTDAEIERPLIGVVSSHNEIVPGHMHLDKITEAVKAGIRLAGGTPIMFPAIAVCDGIAMGHIGMKYSLITRDLIADSTEAMVVAHQFDGLVMIPNCDKNVPGLLMAAARLNIPTIFCSGGPMLAGHLKDGRRTCLSHMFEAVGAYHAGTLDEAGVDEYTKNACPSCGSCSGMYTANSMNCLCEAIGMALPGNGTIPAPYSARLRLAKEAGMQIMQLVEKNIRPCDIMTDKAFDNAETVDMALGCSTNTMLHLPAIAHEAGISISLDKSNEISSRTPNLCHLAPAGDTFMEDLDRAGGVLAVYLWNADKDGKQLDTDVVIYMDGVRHVVKPGEEILITPGNSISLTPYIGHIFGPKPGTGDIVVGEVSKVNDDNTDNYWMEPTSRFADIEEDEPILHPLCNEYDKI